MVSLTRAKREGNRIEMGRLRAGIDAQMMPRFDSMTVHMEEAMLFQVVSLCEVAMLRVVMRRIDVTQTLVRI